MRSRLFNSDPIENFCGQVLVYNFRNNDPSCQAFKQIFRSRFINFHSENYNCEDVSGEQILKLKNLLCSSCRDEDEVAIPSRSFQPAFSSDTDDIQAEAHRERLNVHSRAYTVGWVIRKCLYKIKCAECKSNLCQKELSTAHTWILEKEFKGFKNDKNLIYPTENALRIFGSIVKEANEYLEIKAHLPNVIYSIKNIIKEKYSFDFLKCDEHKNILLNYFLYICIKLTFINLCSVVNKILKGTNIDRLKSVHKIPYMQNKALQKYKKKLKNKKLNK